MTQNAPLTYPFTRSGPLEVPEELSFLHEKPVRQALLPSGDTAWLVTRHEDVRAVLCDPRVSRNIERPGAPQMTKSNPMFQDSNMDPDPPEHTRIRRLVMKAFTATRVERLRPSIETLTEELVQEISIGKPPIDISEALAFPLSIRVICELLGVPAEDQQKFRCWTDAFLSTTKYEKDEIAESMNEMNEYIRVLISTKRESPSDDLISAMINVHDEDENRLSEYELHWWSRLLLLVGYETTARQMGFTVAALLADPRRWEKIRSDRSLIRNASEEILRWKLISGSLSMLRYVTEDIEVGGVTIPKGSGIIPSVESANWDDTVFANVDELDITRAHNQHLTFSAGPHFCIGASLARLELETGISVLLDYFPHLRLAIQPEELRRTQGTLIEGLVEIPVIW